jgi:hypothetical protein
VSGELTVELTVGRPPAGKNINTQAEDVVGIRYQAMTNDDIKTAHSVMRSRVHELARTL